jgi:adenylate kinase
MSKKLILLIGAPGSGKTTDALAITKKHIEVTAYSTGELLEAEKESQSALGKIIGQYKDKGELVPTSITLDTIFEAIQKSPTEVVLLDGFPREKESINSFCDIIYNSHNIELDAVIEIRVSDMVAKERYLSGHEETEEVFQRSLAVYKETIEYIEAFYKDKNLLQVVNGEQELFRVIEDIDKILEDKVTLEPA